MGIFITFEGVEGCGKTTQLRLLAQSLRERGHEVVLTREPGGCQIADRLRNILLDAANSNMTPTAELLLYAAARAQHVAEVISPALAEDKVVLCDRFTDATLAYQGYGRGLDRELISRLNSLATVNIRPDLTILLDCPAETGLGRAMARINSSQGNREERFELESIHFHQRVRNGYLALAALEQDRFMVINGAGTIETTAAAIASSLSTRLPKVLMDAIR